MGKKIIINGKFMSQTVTGVQRYAREILLELDKIVTKEDNIEVVINADAKDIPEYKNIAIKQIGKFSGNLWEQISLPLYVIKNRGICVSLCNMMPVLTPHIAVIHDVSPKANPTFYSWKFRMWYNLVFGLCIHRTRKIITVSEFSKSEICKYYKINPVKIFVIPNAWQHFERIGYDENALEKYNLDKGKYYFALSSMSPNKNFKWIAEAAKNNPDSVFAVAGGINSKVFGADFSFDKPDNLKLLGYVSDEEAKTLMRDCKAFLFPTFYEGFGIPPLEALSTGAKAVVSDASCMREIFEEAVYYIDPNKYGFKISASMNEDFIGQNAVLKKYSWNYSAKNMLDILKDKC